MHQYYGDILGRIDELPAWFDEIGVPRYHEFSPRHLSNIYASEAALAEVSCQGCKRLFHVALTDAFASRQFSLSDEIRLARVHYGDPPNVQCCIAGPSMNSIMHRVLEYWSRDMGVSSGWQRDPVFEGRVAETPLDPPDTITELLEAIEAGAKTIRVQCSSSISRYDLASRLTAALASNGRVLVTYPENYFVVARKMLDGLMLDRHIGAWKDDRTVTLADFGHLEDGRFAVIEQIVVLASPRPSKVSSLQVWKGAVARLTMEANEKVRIEFALRHSCCMIVDPHVVIDNAGTGKVERWLPR